MTIARWEAARRSTGSIEDREIADFSFCWTRLADVLADVEEEEEDDYVLIDPSVGVFPGLFGDFADDSHRDPACRQCQERSLLVRAYVRIPGSRR